MLDRKLVWLCVILLAPDAPARADDAEGKVSGMIGDKKLAGAASGAAADVSWGAFISTRRASGRSTMKAGRF